MNQFIGIPYDKGGRSYEGADCWGLVWLFYRDQLGIDLPEFAEASQLESSKALARFVDANIPTINAKPVLQPERGDLVVMKFRGSPVHIGFWYDHRVFHTLKGHDSVAEHAGSPRIATRIQGYYRVR